MVDISDTIIRSYERDLNSGVAISAVKRHALRKVERYRRRGLDDVAAKLDIWINSNL